MSSAAIEHYDEALYATLRPAIEMQARDELLHEIRLVGTDVRRAYLGYVARHSVVTRAQFVDMLRASNGDIWRSKCLAIYADLSGAGPFPSAA